MNALLAHKIFKCKNQTLRMSEYRDPSLWPVFHSKGSEHEEDAM